MIEDIQIKRATLEDINIIKELNREHFRYEQQFTSIFNENWVETEQAQKHYKDRIKYGIVFLAIHKKNAIGFIFGKAWQNFHARKNPNLAEVEMMYIKEDFRHKGVGRKLFKEFEKEAKNAKDIGCIKVSTLIKSTGAQVFYKECGFTEKEIVLEKNIV